MATPHTLSALTAAADLDEVLELNQHWVPHVSSVTRDELVAIVGQCSVALVARSEDAALAGFVLVLPPGAEYASPNYAFFTARLADGAPDVGEFRYVDRIAVSPDAQGSGVGRRLYEAVIDHARAVGASEVTCEVNLVPPNPDSQAFHASMGFVEVGRQWNYGGTTQVQLLARPV
jgi:predicted GNAT superfamily acetyltransferase